MKLVIDASVAVAASANAVGFHRFRRYELVAPPLMWIEATSALHAMQWRGELRASRPSRCATACSMRMCKPSSRLA
ncbi:MAG: hypothetical protein ACYCU0_11560 [Solirubrobacteraceae bacterium]